MLSTHRHFLMINELRRNALKIFRAALADMDAARAVRNFVSRDEKRLQVANAEYDLHGAHKVYVVALGKAATGMAEAIDEILADRIVAGVISAPAGMKPALSSAWRIFAGGHPVPNEASLEAGRAALGLLDEANHAQALVIFLVSGGGSAMLEAPPDQSVTLDDLRVANELLVTCGATIDEINFLRRSFSAVKGGRLAARAPLARQITLIISDTNDGHTVASGPSIASFEENHDTAALLREYDLEYRLPSSVRCVLAVQENEYSQFQARHHAVELEQTHAVLLPSPREINPIRFYYQLLDQTALTHSAAHHARRLGFDVKLAEDLIEQPIEVGAIELVRRLAESCRGKDAGKRFCLISAGEFRCPVRGAGRGGRNSETVLRALIAHDELIRRNEAASGRIMVLSAGTDGIDGNSPATGAIGDETTLHRARERGLVAEDFLRRSDSYTFFSHLDDAIITGATGTNVRDLRLLLA